MKPKGNIYNSARNKNRPFRMNCLLLVINVGKKFRFKSFYTVAHVKQSIKANNLC